MSLPVLDVAIGLCFIYLLLSLICTSINEVLAGVLRWRGKFLDQGVLRLLSDDAALKDAVFQHPLIEGTTLGARPAYISSKRFAEALLDHVTGEQGSRMNLADVRNGIESVENEQVRKTLKALIPAEMVDASGAQRAIEEWFNEGMERVSGWYKRHAQLYVCVMAAVLTLLLNADSLQIAKALWVNPTLRAQLVEAASSRVAKDAGEEMLPLVEYEDADKPTESKAVWKGRAGLSVEEQNLLAQVMGWDEKVPSYSGLGWAGKIVGWLMTIAAVSLGAPFWFDLLKRFVNVRNAGRPPGEAK